MAGQRTAIETFGLWAGETPRQGVSQATGVTLLRRMTPEGNVSLKIWFRELGPFWVRAPGAMKGSNRFGGALEPLVWAEYHFRVSLRGATLSEVDVKDDFLALRSNPPAMRAALRWAQLLSHKLMDHFPYDELQKIFYWSLKAMAQGLNPDWASARFYWRWLQDWGLAPDFREGGEGAFLVDEAGRRRLMDFFLRGAAPDEISGLTARGLALWLEKQLNLSE